MKTIAPSGFWKWFADNEQGVAAIIDKSVPAEVRRDSYSSLCEAFTASYPGLVVEVGPCDVGSMLVVTADGKKNLFPEVIACVADAPELAHWRIQPFRPRLPNHQGISIYGNSVEGDDLALVVHPPANRKADVAVIIRSDDEFTPNQLASVAFLVLDALLGEWDVETHVAGVERYQIPSGEAWPDDALPLDDAREKFDRLIAPHRTPQ